MIRVIGLVLIALGVLGLLYGGLGYTTREKVLDLGPIQATAERERRIEVPPYVSVGGIIAGTLLVMFPTRRKRR